MAWNNFWNFLVGGTAAGELDETQKNYTQVKALADTSPYSDAHRESFILEIVVDTCNRAGIVPVGALTEALCQIVDDLVDFDGVPFGLPSVSDFAALTLQEAMGLRQLLSRKRRFLTDYERLGQTWREKVIAVLEALLGLLPSTVFKENWGDTDPADSNSGATVSLIDLIERPAETVQRLIVTFHDDDVLKADLFVSLRAQLERRICEASGIEWAERHTTRRRTILPAEAAESVPARVAEMYLQGTPWLRFFMTPLPFAIPYAARFEHTHVVGGSGHGKTQLLQLQIVRDIEESQADGRSVVVMDSQGDMLRTLSHLALVAPRDSAAVANNVIIIDPTDVEYPVGLNMFDFNREGVAALPLVDRERVLNGTIELYEYFFGALLGAELTARQGIIFKYLARLLLEIPDATIHTFRQLMENGEPFRPYMAILPPTARAFFKTRFFDRSFNETKKQVLTRLWGVLSNPTFDRMFSHPRSKVDMFNALQDGKIVFINTAKDLLKEEGASILGRFFIALIAQAALRRSTIPAHERRSCFVYIDEAADYFDDHIGHLLNQARKYKIGLTLAHQNLDQLSPALRASFFSSTSIKFVGGVSSKDATAFAGEMHSDADFVLSQRKRRQTTAFACYVRNVTPQALSISIPLGTVERLPTMDDAQRLALVEANRSRYCVSLADVPAPSPPAGVSMTREGSVLDARQTPPVPSAARLDDQEIHERPAETTDPLPISPEPPDPPPAPKQKPVPARKAKAAVLPPAPLGRGGKQHKYLQSLVKEFAISKGYHAVIEERILDGAGQVDVSLTREDTRIACEISVTTGRDHELGNLEKCLAAGYGHVLFISNDARHVRAMQKIVVGQLDEADVAKIHFVRPEDALTLLEGWAGRPGPTTVRGYKVKTTMAVATEEEAERRRSVVAAVIADSLRQKKP